MLLLLSRQGAWPQKRPRPMPAGPGGKDVVEILAHDSSHGPAEAGHVIAVDGARAFGHELRIARQSRKIKRCGGAAYILQASASFRRMHLQGPRIIFRGEALQQDRQANSIRAGGYFC